MAKQFSRFLVFAYEQYYPSGGLEDVRGEFDAQDAAVAYAKTRISKNDFIVVFDCQTRTVVWESWNH